MRKLLKMPHFIAILFLFCSLSTISQNYYSNDAADSLQKSKIRYFSPGRGGQDRIWDFTKKLGSGESSQVMFMTDSTGVLSVIEPGKVSYYRTTPDTLILLGSESPLEKREYVIEKTAKKFPLEYNYLN